MHQRRSSLITSARRAFEVTPKVLPLPIRQFFSSNTSTKLEFTNTQRLIQWHQKAVDFGLPAPIPRDPDKLSAGPGLPSLIAVGMRAQAVRVNDVTAVGGFAGPGTRVDVLATGIATGSSEPQTETILQNILVLAVGAKTDRSQTGEPQNATVVTLLVSPEDAEKLALANQQGRIQLVLRNSGDTKQETTPAVKNTNLFSGTNPEPAKPKRVKPTPTHAPEIPNLHEIEMIRGPQRETIRLKQ